MPQAINTCPPSAPCFSAIFLTIGCWTSKGTPSELLPKPEYAVMTLRTQEESARKEEREEGKDSHVRLLVVLDQLALEEVRVALDLREAEKRSGVSTGE